MRKTIVSFLGAALVAGAVLMVAPSAFALETGTITGTLASTNAKAIMQAYSYGANCGEDGTSASRYYAASRVRVSASGTYRIADERVDVNGFLGLYDGAFDPSNISKNCVFGVDSGRSETLDAGDYTLVLASYDPETTGLVTFTYEGPGHITDVVAPPVAVPTLTGWALIVLCFLFAGVASPMIVRLGRQEA